MSEAPYLEKVKEALDEYDQEMKYFNVEIAGSYYFEEKKGWSGVKIQTYHDGIHVLLKILRKHKLIPTQINNREDEEGLEIYVDLFDSVGDIVY